MHRIFKMFAQAFRSLTATVATLRHLGLFNCRLIGYLLCAFREKERYKRSGWLEKIQARLSSKKSRL